MAQRWPKHVRPRLHITVPYWLNDPCAPCFDPDTALYHLFYQCNPASTNWASMSWGHVTSKDLLHWTFMPKQPALSPDRKYDKEGIFTGGMLPKRSSDKFYAFYSSVCKLPFHWSTPPYPRNSVGLAMATSSDGGKTWVKSSQNPILPGEPRDIHVSGYRDPYIAPWKELDHIRGSQETLYGLVSGGIHDRGPTSFLYAVQPDKPEMWEYLGPLVDLPMSWNPSTKWSGNFGINWECVNFMTLESESDDVNQSSKSLQFLIIGAEGDVERPDVKRHVERRSLPPRTVRTQVWMQGELEKSKSGRVQFKHSYSGLFDHGPYYAANSFLDPQTKRTIVYGWIPDEDCSLKYAERKGWNGALALPREVFVQSLSNVTAALRTPLQDITSITFDREHLQLGGATTIETMGIRPIRELFELRDNALKTHKLDSFNLAGEPHTTRKITDTTDLTWELEAKIALSPTCTKLGFHLRHSQDLSVRTTLTFDTVEETVRLDRSKSLSNPALRAHVNTSPDSGPFTLFKTRKPQSGAGEGLEKLEIRVFSDGDVLEVFANDRFALATTVYAGNYEACGGITLFAEDSNEDSDWTCVVESIRVWDGLNGGQSLLSGWNHVGLKESGSSEGHRL